MSTLADQTPDIPLITLHDGSRIPQIGLACCASTMRALRAVVESALEAGYRHIDGAAGYNNEAGVGRALQNDGLHAG
jgi:2,5-diketo-D-gluconate reductase A